jgi:2-amino-4-hydroxy-6-hydroxymethyldihydropteridine diphosphokinase
MVKQNKVFLLLGSNIEPRYNYIKKAEKRIGKDIGNIVQSSSIYESEPIGFNSDTSFLNKVIIIETEFTALHTLNVIHIIENELGRVRKTLGYASRTLDIDILYFNNDIISSDMLTIPHARLHERRFTLLPLVEIAPGFTNPALKINNKRLLEICSDNSNVSTFNIGKI